MVKQIAAAVSYPALRNTVLPRTPEAGSPGLDAEVLDRVDNFFIEQRAAIKDQVARCGVVRKRLAQLLNDPSAGRVLGHIAVKDTPPVMRNDEEAVKNAEGERWHGEEVHCSNGFSVITQEDRPSLCGLRTSRRFPHPAQYGSFRNIVAEHLQLTMNARCAPGWVLSNHAEDQFA